MAESDWRKFRATNALMVTDQTVKSIDYTPFLSPSIGANLPKTLFSNISG